MSSFVSILFSVAERSVAAPSYRSIRSEVEVVNNLWSLEEFIACFGRNVGIAEGYDSGPEADFRLPLKQTKNEWGVLLQTGWVQSQVKVGIYRMA